MFYNRFVHLRILSPTIRLSTYSSKDKLRDSKTGSSIINQLTLKSPGESDRLITAYERLSYCNNMGKSVRGVGIREEVGKSQILWNCTKKFKIKNSIKKIVVQ